MEKKRKRKIISLVILILISFCSCQIKSHFFYYNFIGEIEKTAFAAENTEKTRNEDLTIENINTINENNNMDNSTDKNDILKEEEEKQEQLPLEQEDLETEIPKIPLTLTQDKNNITISWIPTSQAIQYAVYLDQGDMQQELWTKVQEPQVTISLTEGIKAYIQVISLDEHESPLESSERCKLLLPEKISEVFTCSYDQEKVLLTWKESAQAEYYIIYRKQKIDGDFKEIFRTKECQYFDTEIHADKNYRYRVVPVVQLLNYIDIMGGAGTCSFSNKVIVATDHQKYSYKEMSDDIKELTMKYHGIIQSEIIGQSADKRNIYDVIIGNPDAKKTMLVVSTLHAREYMASLLCMKQIEYYLEKYHKKIEGNKVSSVLDTIAIHYIPMANPDGVTISQFGIDQIRKASLRKKLSRINKGSISLWKANARGVDLNRNFPFKFKKYGSSGREGYSGAYAASEKETKAVLSLVKKLKNKKNLQGVVNYHAMGSIVFGDCRPKAAIRGKTTKMYRLARNVTGYISAAGYSSSKSRGSEGNFREYVMYVKKLPSITLEIGRRSCPGPIWEFPSIWNKNKKLIFLEANLLS